MIAAQGGPLNAWARTVLRVAGALAGTALLLAIGGCTAASSPAGPGIGASEQAVPSALASAASSGESPASSWIATGDMITARVGFTATLLPNGKVLVAGGLPTGGDTLVSPALASAELYDVASGTWTATGSMTTGRVQQSATLLPNGTVLVAGGFGETNGNSLVSAELYDPISGTWTATASLIEDTGGTATLLGNGKVLVAGGFDSRGQVLVASAELYDPVTATWTATASMRHTRGGDTATLLRDGRVLVVGGDSSTDTDDQTASAELYDPVSGTWTSTADMGTTRANHTATLLPDGTVLVAGGANSGGLLDSAELYDPSSGAWTATPIMVHARGDYTATLLPNGMILVVGGDSRQPGQRLTASELYDPSRGTWTAGPNLAHARAVHTATLLANGMVLVTGGEGSSDRVLASAELYEAGSGN
jgi:hypothetical protein